MNDDCMSILKCKDENDTHDLMIFDKEILPPIYESMIEFAALNNESMRSTQYQYKYFCYQSPRHAQLYSLSIFWWFNNNTVFIHPSEGNPIIQTTKAKWKTRWNRLFNSD
eukprot:1007626_1